MSYLQMIGVGLVALPYAGALVTYVYLSYKALGLRVMLTITGCLAATMASTLGGLWLLHNG